MDAGSDDALIRVRFGDRVANAVDAMTKEFRGLRSGEAEVFEAIGADPIASVVKLCDRIHNHSSMVGVLTPAMISNYVDETTEYFLPMLQRARRTFCDQEPIYEALNLVLHTQIDLLHALSGTMTL